MRSSTTITAGALRARLGEVLDRASAGERIVIERDHKPLAVLVSCEDAARIDPDEKRVARRLAALDRLDALRGVSPASTGGLTMHRMR